MVNTIGLDIAHLDANASQPEVVVNAGFDAFDARITAKVAIAIGSSNTVTLTQDQQAAGSMFVIADASPGSTGAFNVILNPTRLGIFSMRNTTGHVATIKITGQIEIPPTLNPNTTGIFQSDGINVERIV